MEEPQTPVMDDFEIRRKVESIAGKNARVIDCEKKSSFVSEETLMVNGTPIKLEGKTGERIKDALKAGQPPPVELLSEILVQAGIEKNPIQLETTMTVKSSTKTSELSTLRDRNGRLVDENLKEFEEDDEIQTASVEIWEKESEKAEKLRKTIDNFRASVEPMFIIPKPLPRTNTPPKTPQSPQSPPTGSPNGFYNNNASLPPKFPSKLNLNKMNFAKYSPPSPTNNNIQRPNVPPPRIPPLMTPLKLSSRTNSPKQKPIPPPKPSKAKLHQIYSSGSTLSSTTSSTESLRETNSTSNLSNLQPFQLPVRVVYETFI